ncbi:LapA family protein [Motiliproteus sediminis]|uniref:LapA family protein n=1 Tax=Motiliproteus sediminis TaxID=1468178 RepID=UPI001AEFAA15
MRLIKGILVLVGLVVLLLAGVLLTVNNQQQIAVDLVFFQLPEASIARWLMLSFVGGALLSFVLGVVAILALRTQLRNARRKIRNSERELDKLRTAHLNQTS